MNIRVCKRCGKEFVKKNGRDYCCRCAPIVKKEKHQIQGREYDKKIGTAKKKEKYHKKQLIGLEKNRKWEGTHWTEGESHGIKIVLPFTRDFSKNKIMVGSNGRIVRLAAVHKARKNLAAEIGLLQHKFYQGKIWITLKIYQPDHKGDALNYLDNVADAIQDAIGINDKWYSVKEIDWTIDKDDPRIEIWITQVVKEHHAVCSICGREIPFSGFPEKVAEALEQQLVKKGHVGHKICKECNL